MTDTPPRSDETHNPTALIVEDDVDLADLYGAWLSEDFDVRTTHDGAEALDALTDRVDVIVLDRRLPDRTGKTLLEDMRSAVDRGVVLVSAVPPDFDVVDLDFDEYLTKPIDREQLVTAVESVLGRTNDDETDRTLDRLLATRDVLRAEKPDSELRESDEYTKLQGRIREIRSTDDDSTAAIEDGSPEAERVSERDGGAESDPPDS